MLQTKHIYNNEKLFLNFYFLISNYNTYLCTQINK